MKNLIILVFFGLFLYSCRPSKNEIASGNYVELGDDLKEIVARYINYQPCSDCIYEIYFNKIEPHYSEVILYKGNNSLTINENGRNQKSPVLYTVILDKRIDVYTGGEAYFKASKNEGVYVKGRESNKSFNVWVISDTLNTRKIDTLAHAYPFFLLPVKRKFPSPLVSSNSNY